MRLSGSSFYRSLKYTGADTDAYEPDYNWNQKSGYPTLCDRRDIAELGVTSQHRSSFVSLKDYLDMGLWG